MGHVLNAAEFPLHGSRLIEASAGTGKTWTIAALYLRLVLGHGGAQAFGRPLMPPDILVMTFTRAATRELSDRIRARLVEAVACFRGERPVPAHDSLLQTLLEAHPEGPARQQAAWRLAMAAECMDDAAIHTIDAWCQRMLREHAFDSGSLFDETLEPDEQQRQTEAAQDYWRQQCYPLAGPALDALLAVWPGVDALVQDMRNLSPEPVPDGAGDGTAGELVVRLTQAREAGLTALAQGWGARAQRFEDWLDGQLATNKAAWNGSRLQARYYKPWFQTLRDWAVAPHSALAQHLKTGASRLVPQGLDEARKGDVPVALPPESQALAGLLESLQQLPNLDVALRLHAAARVQQRLQWLKHQAGTFGFADMLQRLDQALAGAQGAVLRARILAQYPVALLDEFQDTSPLQYRLFDHIYRTADNDPRSALLLIGDPKQSIYGFRGADIHSYLRARQATQGRHYVLGTNYRSTQALVAAVNQWFARAEARPGEAAFRFRTWQDGQPHNPLPFEPVRAQGRPERLLAQEAPVPAITVAWHAGEGGAALSGDALQSHLAQACAEQIVQWLNDPSVGFVRQDEALGRLRPRDIAVLVRTGREADAVRRQLQRRGVASVYLSDQESVFASAEAQDVLLWLRAVSDPLDSRAVRAGLATRLMGLTLDHLAWLASDDEAFDAQSELLRTLHGIWQRQGVLAMLRQTLHRMGLPARWLADVGGERRLTNVLHLAELLQHASATLEGEQALVRWLATQVESPGAGAEEQVVRLESDADLVKVVTVHKSKGLEYPVVLLPFAASFRALERQRTPFVRVPGPDGERQLRLDYSDAELAQADEERLREDLRLFYVALTRPRHALWMGLGPLSKGKAQACVNERSASGYLLGGDAPRSPADWQQQLQALVADCPDMQATVLPRQVAATALQPRAPAAPLQVPTPYAGSFDQRWAIASFSSLVRDLAASAEAGEPGGASGLPLRPVLPTASLRPADDEPQDAAHAVPALLPGLPVRPSAAAWHRFARGAVVGNFVHDQLEWLSGEDFALAPDATGELADRLRRRCSRAGREDQADDLLAWLAAVVQHPLPPLGCSLADLGAPGSHSPRLAEMEFWLPVAALPAAQVDALCRAHLLPGRDRPALPQRSLHGMLMGFADLVFAHGGRYWVLDYKTNHLGPDGAAYGAPALAQAMLDHRYDVQAALYLLALHRLLRQRLGAAYAPAAQLGGALYFFVRGLDGPAGGVHAEAAPLALLEALEALIDGHTAAPPPLEEGP